MRKWWRCLLALSISLNAARAATVEQAWDADGNYRWTLNVEGDIVVGDTEKLRTKLLDYYNIFGATLETVDLASRGGDVEEAMKMGTLIHRLRLNTQVAVGDATHRPTSSVVHSGKDLVCASACFLVYAGGVNRFGTYIGLHRPYLPKEAASQMSDLQYERFQQQETNKVASYLHAMDIDQFWIDRLLNTSSQNTYYVPIDVGNNKLFHLQGLVPSIEEIVLARCTDHTADLDSQLDALRAADPALTPGTRAKLGQIFTEIQVFAACKRSVLKEIRTAAFAREAAAAFAPNCSDLSDAEANMAASIKAKVAAGTPLAPGEKSFAIELSMKQYAYTECYSLAAQPFVSASWKRQAMDLQRMEARDNRGR